MHSSTSMYRTISFHALALGIALFLLPAAAEIKGTIVWYSGLDLHHRFPEIRSFLKDEEAAYYKNIEVNVIVGSEPVLTIFDGEEEKEQVALSDFKTKDEVHAMLVEKGFEKKSDDEIEELKKVLEEQRQEFIRQNRRKIMKHKKEKEEKERQAQALFAAGYYEDSSDDSEDSSDSSDSSDDEDSSDSSDDEEEAEAGIPHVAPASTTADL